MTGSGYKVDGYGGAYEEERDPLGAIMGTEDPMLYFDEPTYLDMLTEGQPLYLEANPWDPNDGCELDGVAWDCSDIVRQAEYGTVVGAIVVGGQLLKGQVSLQHALNFTGGGWLSVFIPGQDVEFGYDDPDPFKSHTFTLPDQWETIYIQRGGPNANFDPNPDLFVRLDTKQDRELWYRVRDILEFARDDAGCANTFEALGIPSIAKQLANTTIVTQGVFSDQDRDSFWTRGNVNIGPRLREGVTKHRSAADVTEHDWEDTGWNFIALTDAARAESVDYLEAVIIHSFIHSGGTSGRTLHWNEVPWTDHLTLRRTNPSDLHYLGAKYDAAIDACIKGDKKTKRARAKPYEIPTNPPSN